MPANNFVNQYPSIRQMTELIGQKAKEAPKTANSNGLSFEQVLKSKTEESLSLKISKHAAGRMLDRNIDLSEEQWERLESGVAKAGEKGIKESLVMVDNYSFIVNVNNSTVITAVGETDEKIFTNIDGAVIA